MQITGTGGIPYSGNTPTGGTELNGNAAVYLLTKNVSLNELRLDNPTWYGSGNPATATGTVVRNLVLNGSNWANVQLAEADGVVTSDVPVKGIAGDSNNNLWYVINFQPSSTGVPIAANVLEFGPSVTTATNIGQIGTVGSTGSLAAWISNQTVEGGRNVNWTSIGKKYTDATASGVTKQNWATAVKNGTALPTFTAGSSYALAPSDKSIRLAGNKGKKDAANDNEGLLALASPPMYGLPDALWNVPPSRKSKRSKSRPHTLSASYSTSSTWRL
ncbi:hypothetical protein AGMMS49546_22920 [Spirochaetia bacterium]|nr:hypothetical protein AGMMS49546_22920 [Spirochaetia bacterium]